MLGGVSRGPGEETIHMNKCLIVSVAEIYSCLNVQIKNHCQCV
jgi:hypothetical protein